MKVRPIIIGLCLVLVFGAAAYGVFAIGRRFGCEEKHALQAANLAEKIEKL